MNADEAARQSESNAAKKFFSYLRCHTAIKQAADAGLRETHLPNGIPEIVITVLQREGYKISFGHNNTISW